MNERIKELRKDANMTQQDFADKLGIKRNTLAQYEIGRNLPIDAVVKSICREFGVYETWLREGIPPKYIEKDDSFAECVEDMMTTDTPFYDMIKEILITYQKLDDKSQAVLDHYIRELAEGMKKRNAFGALNNHSDSDKIPLEEKAFQNAMIKKHEND